MTIFLIPQVAGARRRNRAFSWHLSLGTALACLTFVVGCSGGDGATCAQGEDCASGGSSGAGGQITGGAWGTGNFGGFGATGGEATGGSGATGGTGGVASVCGNGKVEPGEKCDGNCPVTCPVAPAPCQEWKLIGNPLTCNVECALFAVPGCGVNTCPKNATPSMQLGAKLFSGEFMDEKDVLTGSGSCKLFGNDAAYWWQAPTTGTFDFSMCALGSFYSFGDKIEWSYCQGTITVLEGASCAGAPKAMACQGHKPGNGSVRLQLSAGQQVLVVASSHVDVDKSDGVFTASAPYTVSIEQCVPSCTGKSCGDDGCGGSCGSCAGKDKCNSAGQCVCVPNCSGKECGDNGCGASCGSCASNESCSSSGQCLCTPNCSGKSCGSNGCGGSCGSCGLGYSCSAGSCVADPNACDPVHDAGCAPTEGCWLLSNEKTACSLTGSGTHGSSCTTTSNCAGGHGCFAGTCRKLCQRSNGAGCLGSQVCNGVSGWTTYGVCY